MPITDYKVTDIERDAVKMEGKADPLTGTLAQNQAEFDEYPELVRDNLDGLCDYVATMPISYLSSAAAATTNKGSITGFVPLGTIVELSMTNGNTAVAPTVTIDGVPHTITGMPVIAQLQANSVQTYRLVKTGSTALTYSTTPDYVIEYCTRASGYSYRKFASGRVEDGNTYTPVITAAAGTLTTYTASGTYVKNGNEVTVNVRFAITDKGTASGALFVSIPFATKIQCGGGGAETDAGAGALSVIAGASVSVVTLLKYDATTLAVNGYACSFSISYTTY